VRIPSALTDTWRHEQDWLDTLPDLTRECAELWDLQLEEPVDTPHSLVIPAGEVVLKLSAPSHFEAEHEADALEAGEEWAQFASLPETTSGEPC